MVKCFDKFRISHIPREENKKANTLRKLAVVQCEGLMKGLLVEELNERPQGDHGRAEKEEKCTAGRSPNNVNLGRTGMRSLRAIGSTIYSMIKFPMANGHMEHMSRVREHAILRNRSISGRRLEKYPMVSKGIVLVDPEEKEYSHAIRLNFYASEDDMDYEALLAGLVAFAKSGMKDLPVFIGSKFLVDQVRWNRVPRTERARRYRKEIMDATAPFHRFRITYLPKGLIPKAETLTGLASIRLEFLNQEVSVGVKTRPSVEAQDKLPKKARNIPKKTTSGKSSPTWEDRSWSN
ncbi:reverse transcriptase domain-containing protein [Tanacetum coccineum]